MAKKFSGLFHFLSKDHQRGHIPIPIDPKDWTEEWHTVHYKTYPRLPHVPLERTKPSADFFSLVAQRISRRDFHRDTFTLHDLTTLLFYSCGETSSAPFYHRAQPSGGGRFPIETYVLLFTPLGTHVPSGVYHYAVADHALELLWAREFSREDIGALFTYPWVQNAAAALVYTSVFARNQVKYGERGYRYILIEAGHIGQNIYLVSAALGIACCALGGTYDREIEKLLDIDGVHESLVYAVALGGELGRKIS